MKPARVFVGGPHDGYSETCVRWKESPKIIATAKNFGVALLRTYLLLNEGSIYFLDFPSPVGSYSATPTYAYLENSTEVLLTADWRQPQ